MHSGAGPGPSDIHDSVEARTTAIYDSEDDGDMTLRPSARRMRGTDGDMES
jgi:hypothetical protein